MMMKDQRWVADERGMPVEDIGGSSSRVSVSGETVSFFYSNSGVRTADAGQAAGVLVEAVLAYGPIANSSGDQVGAPMNTSLSFTSTAFTTEIRLSYKDLEALDRLSFANRLSALQAFVTAQKSAVAGTATAMANGDYVVDYRKGILWGLKASTQTSLASAAYKTLQKAGAVASTPSGTGSIAITEDTASTASEIIVKGGSVRRDTAASSAGTDGDWATVNQDATGHAWSREGYQAGGEDNTNGVYATVFKPTAVSTYVETADISAALEASSIIKASAGVLYSTDGRIDSTLASGTYYILVMNSATLPANGAVTLLWYPLKIQHTTGSDSLFSITYGKNGVYGSAGLVICISTTEFTKTIGGAYLSMANMYK